MKTQIKDLLPFLLFPLAVGTFAALLTTGSMETYADFSQPPLSPPGWVFPVVWTILYLLMGFCRLSGGKFWEMHQQCFVFLHFAAVF